MTVRRPGRYATRFERGQHPNHPIDGGAVLLRLEPGRVAARLVWFSNPPGGIGVWSGMAAAALLTRVLLAALLIAAALPVCGCTHAVEVTCCGVVVAELDCDRCGDDALTDACAETGEPAVLAVNDAIPVTADAGSHPAVGSPAPQLLISSIGARAGSARGAPPGPEAATASLLGRGCLLRL